jgi:predicted PurR-regulated permease PerM
MSGRAEQDGRAQDSRATSITGDQPSEVNAAALWDSAARMATVGIFVLLLVICLYFSRPVLLPVVAAALIGTTLSPIVTRAHRYGVPPWAAAIIIVALVIALAALAITALAAPISEGIAHAPEIGASINQRLYLLDRPLAAFRELESALRPGNATVAVEPTNIGMVTPVAAAITPAAAEAILFFATLIFYLAGQMRFRRYVASLFESREAKLRFLRIANEVEESLASYVAIVSIINAILGAIVAGMAWLIGLPDPLILGFLAAALNYMPYIGPACMAFILFALGFVTLPSLGQACVAPAGLIALTTLEGHLVTPTVLGHRLILDPLAVFLAIAFWGWLWGPLGAFLAVPLLIIAMVIFDHTFPSRDPQLPG